MPSNPTRTSNGSTSAPGDDPILEVAGLSCGYGGTTVLWKVDLDVGQGEVVALVGRNGMGKTTLMRTLMGFIEPDKGSIRYKGEQLCGYPASRRARAGIGYVPQGRHIFPNLTVEENLRMGEAVALAKPDRRLQFDLVYQMFPIIRERQRQKGGTLSGGQQQMLAIGRALVGNPDLLLLDEPSEGLQPSIIGEVEDHILRLKSMLELTIFLVEQDCHLIKRVADRCYVLEQGRITDLMVRQEFSDSTRLEECLAL
jgi:urea ABC transporter ATP-binding protein UrtE